MRQEGGGAGGLFIKRVPALNAASSSLIYKIATPPGKSYLRAFKNNLDRRIHLFNLEYMQLTQDA